jgi:transposase
VHVWGGISWKGKTSLVIFEGIMDTRGFIQVLESGLVPFVEKNPLTLLMQDNDPKHASRVAREWMDVNGITWWKTPPESPDINPIENLWHELKEYIRREVKPHTKSELIHGIECFWETVNTCIIPYTELCPHCHV